MRNRILLIATAVLVCLGGVLWWRMASKKKPEVATNPVVTLDETPAPAPTDSETPAPVEAPKESALVLTEPAPETKEEADAYVGVTFGKIPWLKGVLDKDLLVEKAVVAAEAIWRDENPLRKLPDLATPGSLAVMDKDGQLQLDPANAARYAPFMAMVDQVDEAELAKVYGHLRPLLTQAFMELGNTHVTWDQLVEQVLDKISGMELPADPPELKQAGKYYAFVDPALEKLPPMHKLLIRLGPEQTRRLQEKIRSFRALTRIE